MKGTMYYLKLELTNLPTSLNKKLRWGAKWKNVSENRFWDNEIRFLTLRKLPPVPLKRAKLKIVKHFWRTMDFDGFVGSMKPVVDALVSAGILEDDSWKVLQAWEVDQVFRPKKNGPLLQIEILEL